MYLLYMYYIYYVYIVYNIDVNIDVIQENRPSSLSTGKSLEL